MERKYGWLKQPDDYKDLKAFSIAKPSSLIIPDEIDLSKIMVPCYDQLQTSSCTGNAAAGLSQYAQIKAGLPSFTPSRLAIYYNGRDIEGTEGQDAGANIRDVIKGMNEFGFFPETEWPFDPDNVTTAPPVVSDAIQNRIHLYASLDLTVIDSLRMCLFHGYPIDFGFQVYDYFESQQMSNNPVLHLPTASEAYLGGHSTDIFGCDHPNQRFLIRNSWGTSWAPSLKGYFWMDYDYVVSSLCSDAWMLRLS